MRRLAVLALTAALVPGLGQAAVTKASDVVTDEPLSVLQKPENLDRIGRDITLVFADTPGPISPVGRIRARKGASNAFRDTPAACEEALVSTLASMAASARRHGATRIVGLRSFWAGYPTSSAVTYKCGRGKGLTSVSLVGSLEGFRGEPAQVK